MKKIKRKFPSKDAYMLEVASALHILFVNSLADFTAFDTNLNFNFAIAWKAKIDEAYSLHSNNHIEDIQAQKTAEIAEIMTLCRFKYKEIKFFAFKSFEKNNKKRAEFGIKEYTKANRNAITMTAFMNQLYAAALKYKTILIANGLKLTDIEKTQDLSIQLAESITTRNQYMKAKKNTTKDRIKILNQCYAYTRTVINAAMLVYDNDFARKKAFVFWQGKHRKYL